MEGLGEILAPLLFGHIMATFLTLTNLALGRINEVLLTSSTFPSASGPQLVMQTAINASISDINRRFQQWPFNYGKQTFNTVASITGSINNEYTPPSTVKVIKWNTFGIQRNDAAVPPQVASTLTEIDYNLWASRIRPQDLQLSTGNFSTPRYVIKGDDGNIILSSPPDAVYTVYYDAWSDPLALNLYSDTSAIPDSYNYVIIDGAMYYGYDFRSDQAAQDRAKAKFDSGVQEMLRELVKPATGFQSTLIQNNRTFNSIPSRFGL